MSNEAAYYRNAREDVQPLVPEHVSSVLEVGAGALTFARWLLDHRQIERYDYIEANASADFEDPRLHRVAEDAATWRPEGERYELVVALDVVEHIVEHLALVDAMTSALRPGGHLLLSIPNVAHYSVLRRVLAGRFPYTDSGILDRTHVRFFTPVMVDEMCESRGLTRVANVYKNRWGQGVRLMRRYRCFQYLSLWRRS